MHLVELTCYLFSMISLILVAWLSHHSDAPYDWHMTCSRFVEKRLEIRLDRHFTDREKSMLIDYFRGKVDSKCDQLLTYHNFDRATI